MTSERLVALIAELAAELRDTEERAAHLREALATIRTLLPPIDTPEAAPSRASQVRPVIHGRSRYQYAGCRCEVCVTAARNEHRKLKGKPPPSHGDSGYSNYGCRCNVCRAAHSEAMRRYIAKRSRPLTIAG